MKLKHYRAADMRQALRLVRDAQGPDAVILSTRRVNGGVEVVAAVDYDTEAGVDTYGREEEAAAVASDVGARAGAASKTTATLQAPARERPATARAQADSERE